MNTIQQSQGSYYQKLKPGFETSHRSPGQVQALAEYLELHVMAFNDKKQYSSYHFAIQ